MNLLKRSYLAVLIAPVLLLSGAVQGETPSNEKQPLNQAEPKTNTNKDAKETENLKPSIVESASHSTADTKQDTTEKRPPQWYDLLCDTQLPNWLVVLGWAVAAYFAWRTLNEISRQSTIASSAASAAEESARATRLALQVDRPYLMVENITISGFANPSALQMTTAILILKNFGKSPALIDESIGALKIVKGILPLRDFDGCKDLGAAEVVSPGQSMRESVLLMTKVISPSERQDIVDEKRKLVAYGQIRYRDFIGNSYIEGFYWELDGRSQFFADTLGSVKEPKMRRGPNAHNYHE